MNNKHDNAITDREQLQRLHPLRQPAKASDKAIKYLRDLTAQRDYEQEVSKLPPQWQELFHQIQADPYNQPYAHTDVSKFIDLLKSCPNKVDRTPYTNPMANQGKPMNYGILEDGMYRGPSPNNHIYKVYHAVQSNQQVAKRLTFKPAEQQPTKGGHVAATFKYEGKAPLKFLNPSMRLSLKEAMEFGQLYGTCCICGRTLTNELSIHLGIGPVCGRREFGGQFELLIKRAALNTQQQSADANNT
jgi:hypothetical protein